MVTLTGGDLIGLFVVSLTWAWALSKFLKVTLLVAKIDPVVDGDDGSFTGLVLLCEKKAKF